ncbi:MAG: hypothetical protein ABMA13_01610 [Chthoniobacteraceae bacterium]
MRHHFIAILLVAAGPVFADIDLTPQTIATQFGGFTAGRVQFADGDKKVSVSLDSDAHASPDESGTVFRFGGIPDAKVRMRRSPLNATVPFDADGLVQYQKAAVQMLPQSAQSVAQEEAAAESESINGGQSYRFVFTYSVAGVPLRESIVFLNIDARQQIVVQTIGIVKSFDAATQRAVRLIRDWHFTTPSEEKGEN